MPFSSSEQRDAKGRWVASGGFFRPQNLTGKKGGFQKPKPATDSSPSPSGEYMKVGGRTYHVNLPATGYGYWIAPNGDVNVVNGYQQHGHEAVKLTGLSAPSQALSQRRWVQASGGIDADGHITTTNSFGAYVNQWTKPALAASLIVAKAYHRRGLESIFQSGGLDKEPITETISPDEDFEEGTERVVRKLNPVDSSGDSYEGLWPDGFHDEEFPRPKEPSVVKGGGQDLDRIEVSP